MQSDTGRFSELSLSGTLCLISTHFPAGDTWILVQDSIDLFDGALSVIINAQNLLYVIGDRLSGKTTAFGAVDPGSSPGPRASR